MADGHFPTLISKDRLANSVTNPVFVTPSDGTSAFALGGGVEAGALLVTMASDSTGVLSVDDNGGSITIDNSTLAVVGGGTEATALRVTIANDSTGTLTVDGSVTVSATDLDIRALVHTTDSVAMGDGTGLLMDLVTLNSAYSGTAVALPVAGRYQATPDTYGDGDATALLTDANGKLVLSNPGGTEYVEDAVAPANATASTILVERDDVLSTITPIEGDWSKLYCNAYGALWVRPESNQEDDTSHFTADIGNYVLAVRNDTLSAIVNNDKDYAPFQVNALGALYVEVASGTITTASESAEDTSHFTDDIGTFIMAVRHDTLSTLVNNNNDYAGLQVDADGALYCTIRDGGNSITVDAVNLDIRDIVHTQDSIQIGDGTSITLDIGEVDSVAGATDSGILALAVRDDALTTLTPADGDYTQLRVDSTGRLWTIGTLSNTETTPIYVYQVNSVVSGYEIHSYDTQAALASDTPDNHDYTVTGTNFMLKQILVSSSGACKIEVQTGPVASLATIAVGFIPKHGGSWDWTLAVAKEVPVTSTGTVRVIRTNREGAAQDVYSTIIGNDV